MIGLVASVLASVIALVSVELLRHWRLHVSTRDCVPQRHDIWMSIWSTGLVVDMITPQGVIVRLANERSPRYLSHAEWIDLIRREWLVRYEDLSPCSHRSRNLPSD